MHTDASYHADRTCGHTNRTCTPDLVLWFVVVPRTAAALCLQELPLLEGGRQPVLLWPQPSSLSLSAVSSLLPWSFMQMCVCHGSMLELLVFVRSNGCRGMYESERPRLVRHAIPTDLPFPFRPPIEVVMPVVWSTCTAARKRGSTTPTAPSSGPRTARRCHEPSPSALRTSL
jgi:hypothetical protein